MAFDVGVGVGIEGFGELDVKAIVPDFDRTSWGCGGVIAHGDVFNRRPNLTHDRRRTLTHPNC